MTYVLLFSFKVSWLEFSIVSTCFWLFVFYHVNYSWTWFTFKSRYNRSKLVMFASFRWFQFSKHNQQNWWQFQIEDQCKLTNEVCVLPTILFHNNKDTCASLKSRKLNIEECCFWFWSKVKHMCSGRFTMGSKMVTGYISLNQIMCIQPQIPTPTFLNNFFLHFSDHNFETRLD